MVSLGELIFQLGLDDTKFNTQLNTADKKMKAFGESAKKVGSTLTKNLTVPIAGLGVAALKLASDFEVSSRKFSKAFEGASSEANSAVNDLNKNYGIAISQSTELLAFTGDLLKGFGASSTEALGLSTEVQKLAASLSAYNGIPVA